MLLLALAVAAAVCALLAVWGWAGQRRERVRADAAEARLSCAGAELARLEERSRNLEHTRATVEDAFKAMSADAVARSADELLKRAEEAFQSRDRLAQERLSRQLQPVAETLTRFEAQVSALEKTRAEDSGGLKAQIEALLQASTATQTEARRLTDALKRGPGVRGRWGEQTLRNVLESSGMHGRFDFQEQVSITGDDGRLRPDVVVSMPGGGRFVIDAKVSLNAYLDAQACGDEAGREAAQEAALRLHAESVKRHMAELSGKAYWAALEAGGQRSPDFVAMFIPGDAFLCAALERAPDLMTDALARRVVIVTPTTLFALLKAVTYGWRAEEQAANAREVAELGRELHKRLSVMGGHVGDLGESLRKAVERYNRFVGSLESQVLTQARRFEELSVDHVAKTIDEPPLLEVSPRALSKLAGVSAELLARPPH